MFWNKVEVFMTMEAGRYAKARAILEDKGIPCTVNTKSSGGYSANSHRMGRFGENIDHSITYYIYTDRDKAESARYHIQSNLNR